MRARPSNLKGPSRERVVVSQTSLEGPAWGEGRRRILLTGATGAWGRVTLTALRQHADHLAITALVLPTRDQDAAAEEIGEPGAVRVVRGDLTDAPLMARLVTEADLVVHLGGMVSPAADQDPVRTRRVNVGTMRNIVAGVKALPDPSRVTVVGVGSVAQTGPRPQPVHWGRVGDPLRASDMDLYTQSKIAAERILVDSGLPRWTWLRQTGMLSPAVLRQRDPIALHVPLDGVIEWVSDLDSARLLTRIALGECDESLFARVHNVGGGRAWRLTNWEILTRLARAMGARGISQWYERNWFATGSFHGHWFTDSDALEQIVPFRSEDPTTAIARCVAASPWVVRRAGLWPGWLVRALVTGPMARAPRGTLRALHDGDERAVRAFFGSRQAWEEIGDWSGFVVPAPSRRPSYLDHGYDESVGMRQWDASLYRQAAAFHGGELLSADVVAGQARRLLTWRCCQGHEFTASPVLVLHAGHWCPRCTADTQGYERQAEENAFLAQVVVPR